LSSLLRLNLPSGLSLPFRYSVAENLVELEQKPPYTEQNKTRNVNGHDVIRHINTKAWEKSVIFIDDYRYLSPRSHLNNFVRRCNLPAWCQASSAEGKTFYVLITWSPAWCGPVFLEKSSRDLWPIGAKGRCKTGMIWINSIPIYYVFVSFRPWVHHFSCQQRYINSRSFEPTPFVKKTPQQAAVSRSF
jgi:hypothetical protein